MSNIRHEMITYVNSSSNRRDACDRLLTYAIVLRQNIVDNDKQVVPLDDVYPLSPMLSKRLFDKGDPLDRQVLSLVKEGTLSAVVVKLKDTGDGIR